MGLRFRQIIQLIAFFAITTYCSSVIATTPIPKISTQTGLKAPGSQSTAGTFNKWTTNGPYGGEVRALAIDPKSPTTLYAGVQCGGIFKSIDGAANWRKLVLNLPASVNAIQINTIAVDPVNPSILYAGLYWYGIVKSTDGGESWSQINTGLGEMNVRTIAVDPSQPDTLYAATDGGGMFKSDNGGGSWSPINTGLPILSAGCIVLKPGSPDTLFIGIWGEGVFKSTDGGTTWNPANSGLSNLDVVSLVIDPVTPTTIYAGTANGGVFKSTNDGGAWILVKTGQIRTLVIDTAEPSNLYAGMNDTDTNTNGIFKSSNGGETWDKIYGHEFEMANAIAIVPSSAAVVYAGVGMISGAGSGVLKSTDHGATWSQAANGLMGAYVQDLAIDAGTSKLYAGAISGAFRSLDHGNSWEGMPVGQGEGFIRTIALDPFDPDILYAAFTDKGIFKSMDGGDSWNESNAGLTDTMVTSIVIDPMTPDTLYAWTPNGGLHKSLDGAVHWVPISTTLPSGQFSSLVIDPKTPLTLYFTGWNQGVYKSLDGGIIWNPAISGLPDNYVSCLAVDPITPLTLYAATGSGVFKSTDGGATWNSMNTGLTDMLVNTMAIDPANPSTVFAGTFTKGVFKSIDGGVTWRALPPAFDGYFSINAIVFDPNDAGTIFVGTGDMMYNRKNGGVFQLTQAPEITTTPVSLDFGQTTINKSGSLTVTISNSGFEPLQMTGFSISGPDSASFGVAPGGPHPCSSLTPLIPEGESCNVMVTFTPSTTGALTGSLNIASTAVNTPALELPLSGTGVLPRHSLTTNIVGSGTINNITAPPAFSCSSQSCSESFDLGTALILRATPSALFEFTGWSGDGCSGPGDCSLNLNADTTITATFSPLPLVQVTGNPTSFLALHEAYSAASDGSRLKARNVPFTEDLNLERPVSVSLNGGLESDFATVNGYTYLQGILMVNSGSLVVDNLIIK